MAEPIITQDGLLLNNGRVFLPSRNINIFPCSRRGGQYKYETTDANGNTAIVTGYYDPEARLNTERTNRISTAVNGFTDSFVVNDSFNTGDTLIFVLAGYRVEAKNFKPSDIAAALGVYNGTIYAHLSLHDGISLNDDDYVTEILYRQSEKPHNKNYLDVSYPLSESTDDFFVGISFATSPVKDKIQIKENNITITKELIAYDLPIFESGELDGSWKLVQVSLLPKIKHGTTENSVVVEGNTLLNSTLDVNGDTTIKSSLKVEDNINVGNLEDAEKVTTNGGGYVVAKNDIITKKDLKASNNISAGGSAAIAVDLTVGTDNNANTGTITAKKLVKAPTLEAANQLNVQSGSTTNPAKAYIDKANIVTADITSSLNVHNDSNTAKITADEVQIDKDLIVYDTIIATKDLGTTKNNLDVKKAKIDTLSNTNLTSTNLTSTTATIDTIKGTDIKQNVNNDYYGVPVIFVQQQNSATSNVYQLQISRANILPYKNS